VRFCFATRRAGMTLVELLVVVAIIGLLAVTVLPSVANSNDGRKAREAGRVITSFIAKSQSLALGRQTGAGFGLIKTGSLATDPALDLVPAVIPEAYRGDTPTAVVTGTAVGSTMTLGFLPTFSTVACDNGDLIRFNGRGAWYSLSGTGTPTSCQLRSTASVDALAGQTAMNTPWPAVSGTFTYEILRGPQPAGGAMTLGDSQCIDLSWSSAGTKQLDLVTTPAAVYVIFDAAGVVRQVVAGQNRFSPDGPIFLLLGRFDRVGQSPVVPLPASGGDDSGGANWQYADSIWIAIDPVSGICRTAACDATAAAQTPVNSGNMTPAEITAWRLQQSQNTIRSVLFTGVQ
jgi:prepilin-type N-terminal cleavage/methylation domain-containing protein